MKLGTAPVMPPDRTGKYKIAWKDIVARLRRGEILTITCDEGEDIQGIRNSGRAQLWKYLPEESVIIRKEGNTLYLCLRATAEKHAAAPAMEPVALVRKAR